MPNLTQLKSTLNEYHLGWVVFFVVVIHVLGPVGIGYGAMYASWSIIVFAVAYYFYVHLGITICAHRYYAHRSYRAKNWFHYVSVLGFGGAFQGAVLYWGGWHKVHHINTDRPGLDPHTPKDGFWHAHCLWVMKRDLAPPSPRQLLIYAKRPEQFRAGIWQSKYRWQINSFMAFGVPTLMGALFDGLEKGFSVEVLLYGALGGFLVGGCARLLFQYHFTWIVNSYGHRNHDVGGDIGSSASVSGVAGVVLAILTVGESNHREHHDEPLHYRIGRLPGQWDPGAWVLEVMVRLGVCSNLVTEPGQVD